jgi:ATP-dependent Zn protease
MKSKRIAVGIVLFLSIAVTFIWFLSPAKKLANELTLDEAITRVRNKQIEKVTVKQDQLEIIDKSHNRFYTKIDQTSEPGKQIYDAAAGTDTQINLEPASTGYVWILLINSLPFYIMWIVTLAVIVYAVKVLSRNKG